MKMYYTIFDYDNARVGIIESKGNEYEIVSSNQTIFAIIIISCIVLFIIISIVVFCARKRKINGSS